MPQQFVKCSIEETNLEKFLENSKPEVYRWLENFIYKKSWIIIIIINKLISYILAGSSRLGMLQSKVNEVNGK